MWNGIKHGTRSPEVLWRFYLREIQGENRQLYSLVSDETLSHGLLLLFGLLLSGHEGKKTTGERVCYVFRAVLAIKMVVS
jgi:hypothetical protein